MKRVCLPNNVFLAAPHSEHHGRALPMCYSYHMFTHFILTAIKRSVAAFTVFKKRTNIPREQHAACSACALIPIGYDMPFETQVTFGKLHDNAGVIEKVELHASQVRPG